MDENNEKTLCKKKKRNAIVLSFACVLLGIALVLSLVLCGEFEVTRYSFGLGYGYWHDYIVGYAAAFSGSTIALVLFILDCIAFVSGLVCLILFIIFKVSTARNDEKRNNPHTYERRPAVQSNVMDDLVKLKAILDQGIITQEEFDAKKKELLGL